jgi:hypothetical protein
MAKTKEETALTETEKEDDEIGTTALSATARAEVEGSIIIAKKFPRNENDFLDRLLRSCERFSFAEKAYYSFPRGGITVEGASAPFAREAARIWGNIEYGLLIVKDITDTRTIRAWAWDKESNGRVFAEDTFKKLIYRKKEGWVMPDERDLRELTNRRGAILIRNCILSLIPRDMIEDAQIHCKEVLKKSAKQDPKIKEAIINSFAKIGVKVKDLEGYLEHPLSQCTEDELVDLRGIWQSISDGNSKWSEYVTKEESKEPEKGQINLGSFKPATNGVKSKAEESSKESNRSLVDKCIHDRVHMPDEFQKAWKDLKLPMSAGVEDLDEAQLETLHQKISGMVDNA